MERKIKFRGKVVHNDPMKNLEDEWVEGYYFQDLAQDGMRSYIFNCPCKWEVLPYTIGQSTGLHDMNEKEIFEGDIVEWDFTYQYIYANGGVEFRNTIVKGVIKWQQGGFILEVIENDFESAGYYGISALNTDTESDVEIIGNIYDNYELHQLKDD